MVNVSTNCRRCTKQLECFEKDDSICESTKIIDLNSNVNHNFNLRPGLNRRGLLPLASKLSLKTRKSVVATKSKKQQQTNSFQTTFSRSTMLSPATSTKKQNNKDQIFIVENILGHRINSTSNELFLRVHWEGYSSKCDTWEPASSLISQGITPIINEYFSKQKNQLLHSNSHSLFFQLANNSNSFDKIKNENCASNSSSSNSTCSRVSNNSSNHSSNKNSRKRLSNLPKYTYCRKDDLVAIKTKFFNDIDEGKVDLFSVEDMYSRVKNKRRCVTDDSNSNLSSNGSSCSNDMINNNNDDCSKTDDCSKIKISRNLVYNMNSESDCLSSQFPTNSSYLFQSDKSRKNDFNFSCGYFQRSYSSKNFSEEEEIKHLFEKKNVRDKSSSNMNNDHVERSNDEEEENEGDDDDDDDGEKTILLSEPIIFSMEKDLIDEDAISEDGQIESSEMFELDLVDEENRNCDKLNGKISNDVQEDEEFADFSHVEKFKSSIISSSDKNDVFSVSSSEDLSSHKEFDVKIEDCEVDLPICLEKQESNSKKNDAWLNYCNAISQFISIMYENPILLLNRLKNQIENGCGYYTATSSCSSDFSHYKCDHWCVRHPGPELITYLLLAGSSQFFLISPLLKIFIDFWSQNLSRSHLFSVHKIFSENRFDLLSNSLANHRTAPLSYDDSPSDSKEAGQDAFSNCGQINDDSSDDICRGLSVLERVIIGSCNKEDSIRFAIFLVANGCRLFNQRDFLARILCACVKQSGGIVSALAVGLHEKINFLIVCGVSPLERPIWRDPNLIGHSYRNNSTGALSSLLLTSLVEKDESWESWLNNVAAPRLHCHRIRIVHGILAKQVRGCHLLKPCSYELDCISLGKSQLDWLCRRIYLDFWHIITFFHNRLQNIIMRAEYKLVCQNSSLNSSDFRAIYLLAVVEFHIGAVTIFDWKHHPQTVYRFSYPIPIKIDIKINDYQLPSLDQFFSIKGLMLWQIPTDLHKEYSNSLMSCNELNMEVTVAVDFEKSPLCSQIYHMLTNATLRFSFVNLDYVKSLT